MSQMNSTTNVKAAALNYHHYAAAKYDREIVRVIPGHQGIHRAIIRFVKRRFRADGDFQVLDLGVGTGLTSALIQTVFPKAQFEVIDFSRTMLRGAQKRLNTRRTTFVFGDYSRVPLNKNRYDLVISVIGLHHQTDAGKRKMIHKVFRALKPGGYFLLADLMTHRNKREAAVNQARHFHHLVSNARNKKTLTDWAYHHTYLNKLSSVEEHLEWFHEIGFKTQKTFQKMNSVLLIGKK